MGLVYNSNSSRGFLNGGVYKEEAKGGNGYSRKLKKKKLTRASLRSLRSLGYILKNGSGKYVGRNTKT